MSVLHYALQRAFFTRRMNIEASQIFLDPLSQET